MKPKVLATVSSPAVSNMFAMLSSRASVTRRAVHLLARQPADQIVARIEHPLMDEGREVIGNLAEQLVLVRRAVDQLGHPRLQPVMILLRQVDQPQEHRRRQDEGEIGDEIAATPRLQLLNQPDRGGADARHHVDHGLARQRVLHKAAVDAMLGRIEVDRRKSRVPSAGCSRAAASASRSRNAHCRAAPARSAPRRPYTNARRYTASRTPAARAALSLNCSSKKSVPGAPGRNTS